METWKLPVILSHNNKTLSVCCTVLVKIFEEICYSFSKMFKCEFVVPKTF